MELKENQLIEFPLQEYKNRYKVSKEGKIWSNRTKKYLNTFKSDEHNNICIIKPNSNKREQIRVDYIIALAFLGKSDKYLNHIDGNLCNDELSNLEWIEMTYFLHKKYSSIWKSIELYEKYYISTCGQIWSSYSEKLIKQQLVSGYMSVNIGYPKQLFKHVHRLVAKAFCDNTDNKLIVNHIDENKMNNSFDNLEWVTSSENRIHSIKLNIINTIQPNSKSPDNGVKLEWLEKYLITNDGKVYSKKTNKYLTQHLNDSGYYRVNISNDSKTKYYYTHRLVAEAFLPNPSIEQTQVNHKNGNRLDNDYKNLEWMSPSENTQHSKTNNKQQYKHLQKSVAQIDIKTGETIKIHDGLKSAGRDTGVNSGSICKVCKEIKPSAGGFKWKYVD